MSMVSRAIRCCFSGFMLPNVRMLCNRSASFTTMMRISPVMAISICRRFSACTSRPASLTSAAWEPCLESLLTFVSPSTMRRTSGPNCFSIMPNVTYSTSSTVSCSSPAMMLSESMPSRARITATATGCVMYGSPLLRFTPACASRANTYAFSIPSTSAGGRAETSARSSLMP